jgi:cyclin-dependent kinase
MSNNSPLLTGDSDIDQLNKIFRFVSSSSSSRSFNSLTFFSACRLNGTPTEADWKEVENLPFYRNNFPKWYPTRLELSVPLLLSEGIDLMEVRSGLISLCCLFCSSSFLSVETLYL